MRINPRKFFEFFFFLMLCACLMMVYLRGLGCRRADPFSHEIAFYRES